MRLQQMSEAVTAKIWISSCLVESSKVTGRPQRRPVDRVCWAGIAEPPTNAE